MIKNLLKLTTVLCLFPVAGMSTEDYSIQTGKNNLSEVREFEIQFSEGSSPAKIEVRKSNDAKTGFGIEILPDTDGRSLEIRIAQIQDGKKVASRKQLLHFWTNEKNAPRIIKQLGIPEKSWIERSLSGEIRLDGKSVKIWLEGRLFLNEALPEGNHFLSISLGKSTRFEWREIATSHDLYEPLVLSHLIREKTKPENISEHGIPFRVFNQGKAVFSLANAGWPEWKTDPANFYEDYDGHTHLYLMDDGRVPFVQLPKANYKAAHILAYAEEKPGTTNAFTLRLGRRDGDSSSDQSQLQLRDFGAKAPYSAKLQVITIPLHDAYIRNVEGDVLDLEITKEIRLARRSPDPARFRWRPLGLPSNVKIAAITFEKSPLQMEITPAQSGALFELPEKPAYNVTLTNITEQQQDCVLVAAYDGKEQKIKLTVPLGETLTKTLVLDTVKSGYQPLSVTLQNNEGEPLLTYKSTFGILPPDQRKYRNEAPWGTWDFGGTHFTPNEVDEIGEVMRKLGLRHGMFPWSTEERARHGVVRGNEFKVVTATKEPESSATKYHELLKKFPDLPPDFMLFHEDAISGPHATRVPDLFHDHAPYKLNEEESQRFGTMWHVATEAAKSMRREYPNVKIHLGNGGLALREEFYRKGFPAELFDTGGNESASFGRPPESQPPDGIANNASLWMDRQMLDAYGYKEKSISQAYEVIYPATNPGNLSLQTQADYFTRHILHSMVWGVEKIRAGSIADMGNSYYASNWGATGFMHSRSDWTPKPSAIALATLTRVLDGAVYKGFFETGSDSVYLLHFTKKDGSQVLPFWCIRGQREYVLTLKNASKARLITQDGNVSDIAIKDDQISLTASASPAWLELPKETSVLAVKLDAPSYPNSDPSGNISTLSALDSLEGWKLAEKPNPLLDYYNPFTPRRKGDFEIKVENSAWKITPRTIAHGKATMPMYAELVSEKGIPLSGKPAEIGLWVNGNSGWGRIIFELEDASGQRWTSIGAKSQGGSDWMADWLGRELSEGYTPGEIADWNTEDMFGLSRINFDGWRYVGFPLPGQYPGEGYHWPINSQWRWDKDGIVHYPFTLKKVIVELPEKVLYLTEFKLPKRREVHLKNLVSVERDTDTPKSSAYEYVDEAQVTVD